MKKCSRQRSGILFSKMKYSTTNIQNYIDHYLGEWFIMNKEMKIQNGGTMKEKLLLEFVNQYGNAEEAKVYFAPGRVNLIGEHIDYSGGYVLPCALTLGTYGVARKRQDDMI